MTVVYAARAGFWRSGRRADGNANRQIFYARCVVRLPHPATPHVSVAAQDILHQGYTILHLSLKIRKFNLVRDGTLDPCSPPVALVQGKKWFRVFRPDTTAERSRVHSVTHMRASKIQIPRHFGKCRTEVACACAPASTLTSCSRRENVRRS